MPRNPFKRPCAHPGCRAWAKRGHFYCWRHIQFETQRASPDDQSAPEERRTPPDIVAESSRPPGEETPPAATPAVDEQMAQRCLRAAAELTWEACLELRDDVAHGRKSHAEAAAIYTEQVWRLIRASHLLRQFGYDTELMRLVNEGLDEFKERHPDAQV